MFNALYKWYMKTFLPFEDPSHPLHYSGETTSEFEEDLDALIEAELGPHPDQDKMIGPNYARKAFSKPFEYEKWGNKWYKKL